MAEAALALSLVYLFPIALVALLLGSGKSHPRWLVIALLVALPVFYIAHYQLIERIQGWPSDASLPVQFRLLAFEVTEPDSRRGIDGEILIWARGPDAAQPRVHRLPYAKALHQRLIDAGDRQRDGQRQVGRTEQQADSLLAPRREEVRFSDEQRPALPQKQGGD